MDHDHQNCSDLLGNLSSYIDGELSEEMCAEFQKHIAGCENCRVVFDTTTRTIYLYQHNPADETLPAAVRERLFSKLHLDDLIKHE
jgi:anti-sigma factor (TIGR02949 family)